MRWKGGERSQNVEDRRGVSPQMAIGGGGGLLVVVVMIAVQLFGGGQREQQFAANAVKAIQQRQTQPQTSGEGVDDEYREFISVVLRSTEVVWSDLFSEQIRGAAYTPPKLVMFSDAVQTACGQGSSAMGPFYCPADKKVYIDPLFFEDLARRHQAPGDFAQAYVIAHEVAHHVQNLLQFNVPVNRARQSGDEAFANQMSVRLELQADFLAGVWAHYAHREYDLVEPGDREEAIRAANQIGDDTLQRAATGRVIPERFTHGTSAQRARWFGRGFESGRLKDCEQLFELDYSRL